MIKISSKKEGFRRCGVAHPKGVVEYADDHWSKEQLRILTAEPNLTVIIEDESKNPTGQPAPDCPNAAGSIELVKAATTAEGLEKLAEGEERKTVLDAIAKRRGELPPGA